MTITEILDHPQYRNLLAAIRASPDDSLLSLILADWLEEEGQPKWAKYLRKSNGKTRKTRVTCDLLFPEWCRLDAGSVIRDGWVKELADQWGLYHPDVLDLIFALHPVEKVVFDREPELYVECYEISSDPEGDRVMGANAHGRGSHPLTYGPVLATVTRTIANRELYRDRRVIENTIYTGLRESLTWQHCCETRWPGLQFEVR